jgi:hypothetical protein
MAAVVCVVTGLSFNIKPLTWGMLIGGLLCCITQSLCFGYWSISEDDSYVDISVRCWGYFTGLVGVGFGVLAGRMVITLEGLESSGAGA